MGRLGKRTEQLQYGKDHDRESCRTLYRFLTHCLCVTLLVLATASIDTSSSEAEAQNPTITGGSEVLPSEYNPAIGVLTLYEETPIEWMSGITLVSDDQGNQLGISAAHTLDNFIAYVPMWVIFNCRDFTNYPSQCPDREVRVVESVTLHDDPQSDWRDPSTTDLVVVRWRDPITLSGIPLNGPDLLEQGTQHIIRGNGCTTPAGTNNPVQRQAVMMQVAASTAAEYTLIPATQDSGSVCEGDSGGGDLLGTSNNFKLVGVTVRRRGETVTQTEVLSGQLYNWVDNCLKKTCPGYNIVAAQPPGTPTPTSTPSLVPLPTCPATATPQLATPIPSVWTNPQFLPIIINQQCQ